MNRIDPSDYKNGQPPENGDRLSASAEPLTLSAADAAAVDALLGGEAQFPRDAHREAHVAAWLKVLAAAPVPEIPAEKNLADRTFAAIEADRMRLPAPAAAPTASSPASQGEPSASSDALRFATRSKWRRRTAEIASMAIAASLFLAITIDLLGEARQSEKRVACQANLLQVSDAMASYSSQFGGDLPMLAAPANDNWLHGEGPDAPANNAANLMPMLNESLVSVAALFCPGAKAPAHPVVIGATSLPEISYSYRNLYGAQTPYWDGRHETMLLSDRNPIFVPVAQGGGGGGVNPGKERENSLNHGGRGQYVMRADQSVSWEVTPAVGPGGDNIWTIGSGKQQIALYTGAEIPASISDVFMCP